MVVSLSLRKGFLEYHESRNLTEKGEKYHGAFSKEEEDGVGQAVRDCAVF